jgi:hypothetical protein
VYGGQAESLISFFISGGDLYTFFGAGLKRTVVQ